MKIKQFATRTGRVLLNTSLLVSGMLLTTQCTQSDDDGAADSSKLTPSITAKFNAIEDAGASRTVITPDGKVSWDASDNLKAFIVPTGSRTFAGNDYKYVTNASDMKNNKFTAAEGNAPQLQKGSQYDWYVMSPYSSAVTDPIGGTSSSTEFSFDNQTQDCTSPTAHLTKYDVMTGVVKNLDAEVNPTMNMAHKGALMKFTFVSELSEPVTIRNVEFVASDGIYIGGTYSINFEQDGVLTAKNASSSNVLRVINSKPLSAGQSLDTYTMMPAFTLSQGSSLTIRVYTDKGLVEQTMSPKKDITFRAGTINATKFNMKTLKPVYFADGVTQTSGWYDVNKKKDGQSEFGDAVLCWGAASANMLEWWQDRYKEVNGSLPAKAISGKGKNYELAIFERFLNDWDNSHGGQVYFGIPWYFTGEDRATDIGMQGNAVPNKGTGGYFKDEWPAIEELLGAGREYVKYYEAYGTWGEWGDTSRSAHSIVTDLVSDGIAKGAVSLSVVAGFSNQHAITLWGYELNDKGLLSKVYVTDSDDLLKKPQAPRVQLMQQYDVKADNNRCLFLLNTYIGTIEISQVVTFLGYPVK